jgi:hypothetical protein
MKSNNAKHIYIVTAFLAYLLVTLSAWATGTGFTNEFWISSIATSNFYTSGALGTLDSPLDGSTAANFDENMSNLPPNSTIHILAGKYETEGQFGWTVKTGQKILGSGIDVTTIQYANNESSSITIIDSWTNVCTNSEVRDLTIDCNYTSGSYTYCGIDLNGTQNAIRRVKVINTAAYDGEGWGIVLQNFSIPDSVGNVIEDCEVSHYIGGTPGQDISSIAFNAGYAGGGMSGIIRNNRVIITNGISFGINGSDIHDCLVDGNFIEGASTGYYGDTGGSTNILITHNIFKNCESGISQSGYYVRQNMTIAYNDLELATNDGGLQWGIDLNPSASDIVYTNINIIGNTITWPIPGPFTYGAAFVIDVAGVEGLAIVGNRIDETLTNDFAFVTGNYANYPIYDNYGLTGNYLTNLNKVYLGPTPVSSFGQNLVGANTASAGLTTLGLSSNLDQIDLTSDGTTLAFNNGYAANSSISYGTNSTSGVTSSAAGYSFAFGGGQASENSLAFDGGVASYESLAFGYNHVSEGGDGQYAYATYGSLAFGCNYGPGMFPYAYTNSIAIGSGVAYLNSFADGDTAAGGAPPQASVNSFAWGHDTLATNYSFALDPGAIAENNSLAFNNGNAYHESIALGAWAYATNGSFAVSPINPGSDPARATNFQWVCASFTNGYIFKDGPFTIGNNLTVSNNLNVVGNMSGSSLSTTLNNTAPPTTVALTASIGNGASWTNSTSENIVAYVRGFNGNISYNGSPIFTNVTFATVMLQPAAHLSVTNSTGALSAQVNWHPF